MNSDEIIKKYDSLDRKNFDESDIAEELFTIPEKERSETDLAEWIAFALTEGSENTWHTYFGPLYELSNGSFVPSKESITEKTLQYWAIRMENVVNPILKARYSGLLVDFMPKCNGRIRKSYFQSLLDSVNGLYPKNKINGITKLCRAFAIAVSSKNKDDIDMVKESLVKYELAVASDYDVRVWGKSFSLALSNLKYFSDEERAFVDRIEKRISRLCVKSVEGKGAERFDVFVIEQGVELLANYYNKKQNKDDLLRVLNMLSEAFHKSFSTKKPMQKDAMLDKMYRLYDHFQFHTEANIILAELQQNSISLSKELTKTDFAYEIPKQKIFSLTEQMTSGSFDEVIVIFLFSFIPDKNKSEKELLHKVSKDPLFYVISNQFLDYKGRPSSKVGGIESDFNSHLIQRIYGSLNSSHTIIHFFIQKAIMKKLFNVNAILNYIKSCPFFESDRLSIIERGLRAYFEGDLVIFMHLIVPQIENAIRNVVEMSGRSTIRHQKHNNGFELKTFNELLLDDAIVRVDGGSLSLYLRVLFTEQQGWNLRNTICHGIATQSFFNQPAADRVFHALLCVAAIPHPLSN